MNQHIQQLIQHSHSSSGVEGIGGVYTELDPTSLVYSVVQDCVSEVAMVGISNYENEDISWCCRVIIDNIKKKFGM